MGEQVCQEDLSAVDGGVATAESVSFQPGVLLHSLKRFLHLISLPLCRQQLLLDGCILDESHAMLVAAYLRSCQCKLVSGDRPSNAAFGDWRSNRLM